METTINRDELLEILKGLSIVDITNLCSVNKDFRQLYSNTNFWTELIFRTYQREGSTKEDYLFYSKYVALVDGEFKEFLLQVERKKLARQVKYYLYNHTGYNLEPLAFTARSFAGALLKMSARYPERFKQFVEEAIDNDSDSDLDKCSCDSTSSERESEDEEPRSNSSIYSYMKLNIGPKSYHDRDFDHYIFFQLKKLEII